MAGKRGLIMGVANNRSIAWGICKACHEQGAEIALTYQGDVLKKRVVPLAAELGSKLVLPCDVTDTASLDAVFDEIKKAWGSLDFVVHAIAFSDKDQLDGRYVDTTADNFDKTLSISCFSFTAVAQRAEKEGRLSGVDPETLAYALIGTITTSASRWVEDPAHESLANAAPRVRALFEHLIATDRS